MAPPDIKKMISIKLKPRKDPYSDQFSRIVMVKMMMLTAAVTAISWAKDKFTCIVPKVHGLDAGFVAKACWINGVYIYRDLDPKYQSYYHGIPKDISNDGVDPYGVACNTESSGAKNCQPLEKTFFLQYQWFPFGVAALGILYYLPYLLYCVVNADIINIKDAIKKKKADEVNYDDIIKRFFTRKNNSYSMLTSRVLLNVIVKVFYVVANVVAILVVDMSLNGQFMSFGGQWARWLDLSPEERHDYVGERETPKAGHELLPGFGICEVANAAQDVIHSHVNKHVYICELSQHILYQYILIVLWYMLVIGIVVSILGLIKHIFDQVATTCCLTIEGDDAQCVYPQLTIRERQYMDYIRRKNLPVFGELLQRLMAAKGMRNRSMSESSSSSTAHKDKQRMMYE